MRLEASRLPPQHGDAVGVGPPGRDGDRAVDAVSRERRVRDHPRQPVRLGGHVRDVEIEAFPRRQALGVGIEPPAVLDAIR
jgi:hypothetical protein